MEQEIQIGKLPWRKPKEYFAPAIIKLNSLLSHKYANGVHELGARKALPGIIYLLRETRIRLPLAALQILLLFIIHNDSDSRT